VHIRKNLIYITHFVEAKTILFVNIYQHAIFYRFEKYKKIKATKIKLKLVKSWELTKNLVQELRGRMEDRRSSLLQKELQKTLQGIGE
jgi:hypothetical protein